MPNYAPIQLILGDINLLTGYGRCRGE